MDDALPLLKTLTKPYTDMGVKIGANQSCPIPSHDDDSPSFNTWVQEGVIFFKCHGACQATGTIIDLYMAYHSVGHKQAIQDLKDKYTDAESVSDHSPAPQPRKEMLRPTKRADIPALTHVETKRGRSHLFTAHDAKLNIEDADVHVTGAYYPGRGVRGFASLRWDTDKGKVMRQAQFIDGVWHNRQVEKDLVAPLFKLAEVERCKDAVILVEGEKCMVTLQEAIDAHLHRKGIKGHPVVITNIGGSGYPNKTDWRPLHKRSRVFLIPDNDSNGEKWAQHVGRELYENDTNVEMIRLYNHVEQHNKGFDIVDWLDEGNDVDRLFTLQRHRPWENEVEVFDDSDIEFHLGGFVSFTMGKVCKRVVHAQEDGDEDDVVVFAKNAWPIARYRRVEDGERGVLARYLDESRNPKYATVPARAFVDKSTGKAESGRLADQGVEILSDTNHHFAHACGRWRETGNRPLRNIVKTPGWHENGKIYVNGTKIHGAKNWEADPEAPNIISRSSRKGLAHEWFKGIEYYASTPILRVMVGLSMAGPLLHLLDRNPFIGHLAGESSCGKSTAIKLAASLWGSQRHRLLSWNQTPNGIELSAEAANGACLCLDELGRYRGRPESLMSVIHDITSSQGRVRANRSGNARATRYWSMTIASTGEVSMRAKLGDLVQGGLEVRMFDIYAHRGEVTRNAQHSDALYDFVSKKHGTAGDTWIQAVMQFERQNIRDLADEFVVVSYDTAEMGRIMSSISTIGAALSMSHKVGLTPWGDDLIKEDLLFLMDRLNTGRDQLHTPNDRCLELLYSIIDTEPFRFPDAHETKLPNTMIYGYSNTFNDGAKEVWVSERTLHRSGICAKAGVSPRTFLKWCIKEGHCREDDIRDVTGSGERRRWKKFPTAQAHLRDVSRSPEQTELDKL
jgi:hypothetical protein